MPTVPETPPADRQWVFEIRCPRQRALALAIPSICNLTGLRPDLLLKRGQATTSTEEMQSDLRVITLGAIIYLAMEMAISNSQLQGREAKTYARTEIKDLLGCHRGSNVVASLRFEAFRDHGGTLGKLFSAAFDQIRLETFALWQKFHAIQVSNGTLPRRGRVRRPKRASVLPE